jgi:hypothetical protein
MTKMPYVAVVYSPSGEAQFATCKHGVVTVFASKRKAQQAVNFMKDLRPYDARGAVLRAVAEQMDGFLDASVAEQMMDGLDAK